MDIPSGPEWRRIWRGLDYNERQTVLRLAQASRAAADPYIASLVVAYARSRLWYLTHASFLLGAAGAVVIAALLAAGVNPGWAITVVPLAAVILKGRVRVPGLQRAEHLNLEVVTRSAER